MAEGSRLESGQVSKPRGFESLRLRLVMSRDIGIARTPKLGVRARCFSGWVRVAGALVARFVRDEEAVGSNPATPTM